MMQLVIMDGQVMARPPSNTVQGKVVVLWADISNYMAACWKSLDKYLAGDLVIVTPSVGLQSNTSFSPAIMDGLDWRPLDSKGMLPPGVSGMPISAAVVAGWDRGAYVRFASVIARSGARLILAFDNPWRGDFRQVAGRVARRKYLRLFDVAFVPGERARNLGVALGFSASEIHTGLYGVNTDVLLGAHHARQEAQGWPRQFLFAGQLIPRKGFDVLLAAYSQYRESVPDPWTLLVVGDGPLRLRARGQAGIKFRGFVDELGLRGAMSESGCLVLPSRYDAWPLVIAEAAAAGLPILATTTCGSTAELVRAHYNGLLVRSDSPRALASAMSRLSSQDTATLRTWGGRSLALGSAYSPALTAKRWLDVIGN